MTDHQPPACRWGGRVEPRYCAINRNHPNPDTPATACDRCTDDIRHWLNTIPDTYTLLTLFVEHGTTTANPDSKATKRAEAPAPMRLEIIDLLDNRHGRRWLGLVPTTDRRGTAGALKVHTDRLIDERNLTTPHDDANITAACALLNRHLLWLTEQTWIDELHTDLKQLNRALSDAIGDYRPKPVGRCHLPLETQEDPCGGALLANKAGGVRCANCHATWDANELRRLGLAQAEQETA